MDDATEEVEAESEFDIRAELRLQPSVARHSLFPSGGLTTSLAAAAAAAAAAASQRRGSAFVPRDKARGRYHGHCAGGGRIRGAGGAAADALAHVREDLRPLAERTTWTPANSPSLLLHPPPRYLRLHPTATPQRRQLLLRTAPAACRGRAAAAAAVAPKAEHERRV